MADEDAPRPLKLLGVHAAEIATDRLLIVRGRTRLTFEAPEAVAAWAQLQALTAKGGAALEDIVTRLDRPQDGAALALAELLVSRGLLVQADAAERIEGVGLDAAESVFWWDQGRHAQAARDGVSTFRATVLGVNAIGEALWAGLRRAGFSAARWIDHPALRNLQGIAEAEDFEAFADAPGDIDLLVACSDAGAVEALRGWNAFCIAEALPFLSVLFDDSHGLVGPWVQPGRSACFECLWRRWSSVEGPPPPTAERQAQAGPYAAGHLPAMAGLLGQAAAVDINRAAGGLAPRTLNGVLHYDLHETSLARRPLLKAPFCPVCGPGRLAPTLRQDGDGLP